MLKIDQYLGTVDSRVKISSISTHGVESVVTGDTSIKAHQVLLNRVPEQITEDSVWYKIYY